MNKLRNSIALLVTMFMLMGGCENASTANYSINGTVDNYDGKTLVLNYITRQKIEARDTVNIAEDGSFSFSGAIEEAGLFNVKGEKNQNILLFMEPGSSINIDWDMSQQGQYAISGNKESESIQDNTEKVITYRDARKALMTKSMAARGDDVKLGAIAKESQALETTFTNELKEAIKNEPNSLVGLLLLSSINPSAEKDFYNTFLEKLTLQYPNSVYASDFNSFIADLNSRVTPPVVGEMAREIAQESPDGKVYKLSDLRGKYVLVDFWAAWCGPCRRENPNIVANYHKYKNKDFTVYSVSLDRTKNAWVQAIAQDKLDWPYHVSDLKFWSSKAAKDYAVGSIPASFLVDPEGKIIGKNLRGPALEAKLSELLN